MRTITLLIMLLSLSSVADEADTKGREYALKTFKISFPEIYDREYCYSKRDQLIPEFIKLANADINRESTIVISDVDYFTSRFTPRTKLIEGCEDYVRYTKQGHLFKDKQYLHSVLSSFDVVRASLFFVMVALETGGSDNIEASDNKFKKSLKYMVSTLNKHNTESSEHDSP